ncbi:MAG: electron transfer flavoprotein subunit beta/FixA family protein, partial [Bacteroidota bacterium]
CKSLNISDGKAVLEREIEGGKEVIHCPLPVVVSATEGMAEPRIPNMRGIMSARTKPLQVVEPSDVPAFTTVLGYDKPSARSQVKLVESDQTDQLVGMLHSIAKVI